MFHLVRRFFGFLSARPLSPAEQERVRGAIAPELQRLFFSQPPQDQRHALEVLDRTGSADGPVTEAALLHDVGKSASRLGAIQRSLATVAGALKLPLPHRWGLYLDHGAIGAGMLERAGASDLAIAFARLHPGPRPDGIDDRQWTLLASADDA